MVICRVAERVRDRVDRLVFVDALALMPGEQVGGIVNRSTPSETTKITRVPTKEDAQNRLFADLDPDLRSWALARYTLHPLAALKAPMELGNFWEQSWNVTVISCRHSVNPPASHQRRTADKLKASWPELDAGHYPMLSHPEELTKLLLSSYFSASL